MDKGVIVSLDEKRQARERDLRLAARQRLNAAWPTLAEQGLKAWRERFPLGESNPPPTD